METTLDSFFFYSICLMVGLVFGSFVTAVSYRLPRNEDIIWKRSHCTICNHSLSIKDLIPLVSWLLYRGRCAYCQAPISWRYPLLELCVASSILLIAIEHGLSSYSLLLLAITVTLWIIIAIDLEHYIIPDVLHIPLIAALPIYLYILPEKNWLNSLVASITLFLLILAVRFLVSHWKKRESLGMGDVKLLVIIGAYLDIHALPLFLLIAGGSGVFLGIIWQTLGRGKIFPFGPALCLSFFILILYPSLQNENAWLAPLRATLLHLF